MTPHVPTDRAKSRESRAGRAIAIAIVVLLLLRVAVSAEERVRWLLAIGLDERADIVRSGFDERARFTLGAEFDLYDALRAARRGDELVVLYAPSEGRPPSELALFARRFGNLLFPTRVRACSLAGALDATVAEYSGDGGALVARLGGPPVYPGRPDLAPLRVGNGITLFRVEATR